MKLKLQEKRLLWLFFITILFNALSNIISSSETIYSSLTSSAFMILNIFFLVITLVLEIFLVILSVKEIKRGNKALGIIVVILSAIDILMIVLGVAVNLMTNYASF